MKKEKKIKIVFFRKDGKFPMGIYVFEPPNIWRPVVYFRKAKSAKEEEFERILKEFWNIYLELNNLCQNKRKQLKRSGYIQKPCIHSGHFLYLLE